MARTAYIARGVAVLAALATTGAMSACGDDSVDIVRPQAPADSLFRSYVALGNSITAGYQSDGINDSTQRESYPYLIATQSMHTRYAYASIAMPGCTPPLVNIQTGERVGGPEAPTCSLRDPGSLIATLNNVAVPGFTSSDVTDPLGAQAANALTQLILGGETQARKALDADPSFVSVWIGNNDVLQAGYTGVVTPVPGLSRGIIPVEDFNANYDKMLDTLQLQPNLEGVLVGVQNVAAVPHLFPVDALLGIPAFKAGFDLYVGKPTTVSADCVGANAAVSFSIITAFRTVLAANPAYIPTIDCSPAVQAIPGTPPGAFVVDSAEQRLFAEAVTGYNTHIAQQATTLGWAYIDPNPTLLALRASGEVPPVPNLASATQTFGPLFSLDGLHPSGALHRVIADTVISAINQQYGTTLEFVGPTP